MMTKPACKNCLFWLINKNKVFDTVDSETLYFSTKTGEKKRFMGYVTLKNKGFDAAEWKPVQHTIYGKNWNPELDKKGNWGYCKGIPFNADITCTHKKPEDKYFDSKYTNAVCHDGSSYNGSVETLGTFYCANFEQKD